MYTAILGKLLPPLLVAVFPDPADVGGEATFAGQLAAVAQQLLEDVVFHPAHIAGDFNAMLSLGSHAQHNKLPLPNSHTAMCNDAVIARSSMRCIKP